MRELKTGDLVMLAHNSYRNLDTGIVGIVRSVHRDLINVTFPPHGTWAFSRSELTPLTKETTCTQ